MTSHQTSFGYASSEHVPSCLLSSAGNHVPNCLLIVSFPCLEILALTASNVYNSFSIENMQVKYQLHIMGQKMFS
jgi:hypothetical protein